MACVLVRPEQQLGLFLGHREDALSPQVCGPGSGVSVAFTFLPSFSKLLFPAYHVASVLLTFRELEKSMVAPVMDGVGGGTVLVCPLQVRGSVCGGSRALSLLGDHRGHMSEWRKETLGEET